MTSLINFFGWGTPHAHCLPQSWMGPLFLVLHLLISASYMMVGPGMLTLSSYVQVDDRLSRLWRQVAWLLTAGGVTHLVGACMLFVPAYMFEGVALVVTALVAVPTALLFIVRLRPSVHSALQLVHDVRLSNTIPPTQIPRAS